MPRIDPLKLLSCLSVLLSPNGGIKSEQEVPRLASLMAKFSKKLVSKCIYIQILKSSETDLLCEFMGCGGWSLTHLWLQDAITTKNWPLVQEILELLLSCPVDVERLKSNSAPRLVKNLSKDQTTENTEGVRLLANKLVDQWLRIVRGETKPEIDVKQEDEVVKDEEKQEKGKLILKISKNQVVKTEVKEEATPDVVRTDEAETVVEEIVAEDVKVEEDPLAVTEPEKTEEKDDVGTEKKEEKKKDIKEKENKEKDKDRDRHKKSSSSKHKSSSSKSSSSSSSSGSKSKSGNTSSSSNSSSKDRHRSGSSSGSKSKSSSTSSSSSSKDKERKKEKKEKVEEIPQSVKDAKALVETAPNSVFKLGKIPKKPRTEEDNAEKKPTKTVPVVPKAKPSFSIEERDPEKRAKTVKTFNSKFRSHGLEGYEPPPPPSRKDTKPTTTATTSPVATPASTTTSKRPSPTKTIDAPAEKRPKLEERTTNETKSKPKHVLVETDLFSDALAASASSVSRKKIDASKKRKRRLSSTKDDKAPGTPTSPTTATPLKFYQDTLDDENAEKDEGRAAKQSRSSLDNTLNDSEKMDEDEKEDTEDEVPVKKVPGIGTGPDGPPGILKIRTRKGNKKKLTWKVQEELVSVRFFELDETERVNVTKTFVDMQHMDRMQERQSLIMARKLQNEDVMVERTPWAPLIEIDGLIEPPMGKDSVERGVQAARERTILKALYFNRASIPDSPAEPDLEIHPITDPKVVPLDDATCNADGVNDFRNMPWPESKGDAPPPQPVQNTQPFHAFSNFPPPTQVPQMTMPMNPAWAQPMAFVNPGMNALGQMPAMGPPMGMMAPFQPNQVFDGPPMHMGGPMPPFDDRGPPQRDWVRGNSDRYNNRGGNRRNFDDRDRRMGGGNRRNICHNYQKYGNCRLGDKCSYCHPR